jgi:hypothetical protein
MFFKKVWEHFGIQRSIILEKGTIFNNVFCHTLWENIDTKLKRYYTKAMHTLTNKSPFENCLGYFPPFPLDVIYGQQGGAREDTTREALEDEGYINKIN